MFGFRLSSSRPAGATCENVESKPATARLDRDRPQPVGGQSAWVAWQIVMSLRDAPTDENLRFTQQRTDTAVSEWDEGLHGGDPIRLRSARRLPSDCGRPVVYHPTAVGPWFAMRHMRTGPRPAAAGPGPAGQSQALSDQSRRSETALVIPRVPYTLFCRCV